MPETGPHTKTRPGLSLLLWLVGFGLLYWTLRAVSWQETFRAMGRLEPIQILILVGLNLVALFVFGARWWWILRGQGYDIGLVWVTSYRLASFGVSYFTPGPQFGGEPIQVLLLERSHAVPRAIAIASVALDKVLEAAVNFGFLTAAAALLLSSSSERLPRSSGAVLFVAALFAVPVSYLTALWFGLRPVSRAFELARGLFGERALHLVQSSESEARRFCREKTGTLILAILISLSSWGVILAEYWLMAKFLGLTLGFRQLVVGLTAARVAYLLFVPAGLGVFEAGQVVALGSMGFAPALGLSLSLVIRLRDVLLGGMGLWWGLRRLGRRI